MKGTNMEDMDISLAVTIDHSLDLLVDAETELGIVAVFQPNHMPRDVFVVLRDGQVLQVSVRQVSPPRR